jgi:CRISPR-associated protein Cmr1
MKKFEYLVRFTTPAFLGNAEQSGQWRTPPFKALLRQWWRVAWAAGNGFGNGDAVVERMRREEGLLFGNAWLEGDFCKSLVRLRLDRWGAGTLKSWDGLEQEKVQHCEVQKTGYKVGPHAYLGYGPLDGRGNTKFSEKVNAAIQAGESATFAIAFPTTHKSPDLKDLVEANAPRLERALWLMERFGTLGGRSRNGWGSFVLTPLQPAEGAGERDTPPPTRALPLRPWRDCLDRDWPHAIGRDEKGPLIWQTIPHDDWQSLMKTLAIIKIGLRTQFIFPNAKPDGQVHERHWLSYPVTTHKVNEWNKNGLRMPNSLRFKVRALPGGKLIGVIFHVPCRPPPAFASDRQIIEIENVWRRVHAFLDDPEQQLPRSEA